MVQILQAREWGAGIAGTTSIQVTTGGIMTSPATGSPARLNISKLRGGVRYLLANPSLGTSARYGHVYSCAERAGIEQRNRISHSGMISQSVSTRCYIFHLRGSVYVDGSFSTASLFRSVAFFGRRAYAVSQSAVVKKYIVRGGTRTNLTPDYEFLDPHPFAATGVCAVAHIGAHLWFFETGGTRVEVWHPHDDNAQWQQVAVLVAPMNMNAVSYDGKFIWIWNTAASKLYQCSIRS